MNNHLDGLSNTNPAIQVSPAGSPLRSPAVHPPKSLDQPAGGYTAGRKTLDQPGNAWPSTLEELKKRRDLW